MTSDTFAAGDRFWARRCTKLGFLAAALRRMSLWHLVQPVRPLVSGPVGFRRRSRCPLSRLARLADRITVGAFISPVSIFRNRCFERRGGRRVFVSPVSIFRNRCFERLDDLTSPPESGGEPRRSFHRFFQERPAFCTRRQEESGEMNSWTPLGGPYRSNWHILFVALCRHRRNEQLEGRPKT